MRKTVARLGVWGQARHSAKAARRVRGTAALLLGLGTYGCGFLFTQAPPDNHSQLNYFNCTESNVGPTFDVIWSVLNVVGAVVIGSDPDAYENPEAGIAGGLIWGVFSGAAAAVGFGKTRRCREAKAQLAERLSAAPAVAPVAPADDEAAVQAVTISPAVATLVVGEQLQLLATAQNSAGATVPDRSFVWSSSNDAIASVGAAGLVTANAPGSIVVAARTGTIVGTARVTVVVSR